MRTTTIRVRDEVWRALRRLAEAKAEAAGGRPSASGVIECLVEAELVRQEGPKQEGRTCVTRAPN